MTWLLLLLGLVACGDNLTPPTTAEPRSGSRLRLQRVIYADGARQLASTDTVRDLARDEPCTIKPWSDGRRYCTPDTYRTVFLDDTCTTEVARRRSVDRDRRYGLHDFTVAGTDLPSRLYHLGAEVPRDQLSVSFELRDGACVPRTDDADQDRYFSLGDEIDREELVHITRTSVPTGDRLTALVDTSNDGLQLPTALFDSEQQHECQLVARDGDTLTCELGGVADSTTFADPDCTIPAIAINASIALPDLTRRHHGSECDTFHPPTEILHVDTTYRRSGSLCTEAPLNLGDRVFALGEAIELATVERARRDAAHRLQAIEVGDTHFPDRFVFDTELDQECVASPISTTELLCLPTHERPRAVFEDPACETESLAVEIAPSCGVPPPVLALDAAGSLYPVLGPAGDVYELTTGKRCAVALHSFANGVFHLVGDRLPESGFVRATVEFE